MAPTEHVSSGGRHDPENALPADIDASYYDFSSYVSKTRMLTFWHQLDEVLASAPTSVLEVGIGPRIVAGTLRELGIELTTVDINPALQPDIVGSVTDLESAVGADAFDTVLCARVLHHLPWDDFERCLSELAAVARNTVVVTLPVDEARLYLALRRTAGEYRVRSIRLPRRLKALVARSALGRVVGGGDDRYRRLWKIDSEPATSPEQVRRAIERHFHVEKWYTVPEDQSHAVLVLRPK